MLALISINLLYIFETPDLNPYRKLQIKIGAVVIKFAAQKILGATLTVFHKLAFLI